MTEVRIHSLGSDAALVFGGVEWRPLIGTKNLPKQSHALAAKIKATHFVAAAKQSPTVGTIRLNNEPKKGKRRKLYSAAATFALSHSNGAYISRISFDEENSLWYVVASHDGVVVSGTDIICNTEEAEAIAASFFLRFPNAIEVGESETDPANYLDERSELAPVQNAWQTVPSNLKVALAVGIVLIGAKTGWDQWSKYQDRKLREEYVAQKIDAHDEWAKVLDNWASSTFIDGQAGLLRLLDSMGDIPREVGGWRLLEGGCSATPNGWTCSARYIRTVLATNKSFQDSMPKGWTASWDGLNYAIGTWALPAKRVQIDRAGLQASSAYAVDYISKVQNVLAGFRKVEIQPPVMVDVATPIVTQRDAKGRLQAVQVDYPADNKGIERPSIQSFNYQGPLRSLFVLPLTAHTKINQIRFTTDSRAAVVNLRDSALTAELIGESYVF